MRRIRFLALMFALTMLVVAADPAPSLAHDLEPTSATFSGNAFNGGADVVHTGSRPIQHFHVEVYEGSFRFEGGRGKPTESKLANAFAVLAGWTNHGDGTCSHWQEIWEGQSELWTDDGPGLAATFADPYSGAMDLTFTMHGFRHEWLHLEYLPDEDGCPWEERDSDVTTHLGHAMFEIGATWESEITNIGKGKKGKGEEITTTVIFSTVHFDTAPLQIIESNEPPSPYAFSGPTRSEVAILDFLDNH